MHDSQNVPQAVTGLFRQGALGPLSHGNAEEAGHPYAVYLRSALNGHVELNIKTDAAHVMAASRIVRYVLRRVREADGFVVRRPRGPGDDGRQ